MALINKVIRKLSTFIYRLQLRDDLKSLKFVGYNTVVEKGYRFGWPERISIGDNVYIGPDAYFGGDGGLTISDGVMIGPMAYIQTSNHNYDGEGLRALPYDNRIISRPVVIGEYAWLGGRVTILPGVSIGEGAIIGGGSIVTKDIPPLAVAVGNPAKVIKYRDREVYFKLKEAGIHLNHLLEHESNIWVE